METSGELVGVFEEARRLGMVGPGPVDAAIEHAGWFVVALEDLPAGSRVVDLGSGGGLPGLVIAAARVDVTLLLVDRRQKRADFLRRMIRRLGFEHVEVVDDDVEQLVRRDGHRHGFDAATARGFGPPTTTLRAATGLVRPGGTVVISEPPTGDRWDHGVLEDLGVESQRLGPVRRFVVRPG
jgi:16S rRNA (guanine527-N7)-methyltransferase